MKQMAMSLIWVMLAAILVWFVAGLFGIHISLVWTLLLSVILTVVINLASRPLSRPRP